MLSPKNHIRGKCMRNATEASVEQAVVQPDEKAGVEPAFCSPARLKAAIGIFAITGHGRDREELCSNRAIQSTVDRIAPRITKQKGRREAGLFGRSFAESSDQYFAMTGPPQR